MQVSVTFRHVDPSDAVRDYAVEKVTRIVGKYLKRAQDAHVILSVTKRRHQAEINVHSPHFEISAHDVTGDLYTSIDGALSKVEAQLRKHKDRVNHRKGGQSVSSEPTMIPVDVFASEAAEEPTGPQVIETENFPAKPLSVEDAILQLDLSHAEFLVFRNSDTESVSVLYRRRDGNYGLIAPNA